MPRRATLAESPPMDAPSPPPSPPSHAREVSRHPLEDARFREALSRMVRRRVPESDAEDIVQASIAEAFASGKRDEDPDGLRRWVWGVARHKVVDHFRRRRRMTDELPDVADETNPPVHDELDLLRWAKRELPIGENAEETLRWMLREADGETLETIAEESNVPAPRVRKRVSRLREHFRARWSGQVAALVALGVLAVLLAIVALRRGKGDDIAKDKPLPKPSAQEPSPHEVAEEKRRDAFEKCDGGELRRCLDLLDEAQKMDPAGDSAEAVQRARKAANDALSPVPPPMPMKSPDSKDAPTKQMKSDPTAFPTPTATPLAPNNAPKGKTAPMKPTATPTPKGGSLSSDGSEFLPQKK